MVVGEVNRLVDVVLGPVSDWFRRICAVREICAGEMHSRGESWISRRGGQVALDSIIFQWLMPLVVLCRIGMPASIRLCRIDAFDGEFPSAQIEQHANGNAAIPRPYECLSVAVVRHEPERDIDASRWRLVVNPVKHRRRRGVGIGQTAASSKALSHSRSIVGAWAKDFGDKAKPTTTLTNGSAGQQTKAPGSGCRGRVSLLFSSLSIFLSLQRCSVANEVYRTLLRGQLRGRADAMMREKLKGHKPIIAAAPERGNVINLMDALKASLRKRNRRPRAKARRSAEPRQRRRPPLRRLRARPLAKREN